MKKIIYYTQIYFLDCDLPLIRSLIDEGCDVYLFVEITAKKMKSTVVNIDQQITDNGIYNASVYEEFNFFSNYINLDKVYVINRRCTVFGFKNLKLRLSVFNLIKTLNPDIIHLGEFLDMYDFFLYRYKKKLVQIVHDPFPHLGENNFRREFFRRIAFYLIPKFVLLNSIQREEFKNVYNIADSKIFLNSLGTYDCLHLFKSEIDFGFGKDYVLFFGRISKYKGLDILLQAWDELKRRNRNIKFVIAGTGTLPSQIANYISDESIHVLNRYVSMTELYSLINNAKIVVCPYLEATQSGVVMTAFTLDKPVIVTNVGGLSEMVNSLSGLVIEPNNVSDLVLAIEKCYDDSILYNKMVRSIISQKIDGNISWKIIARKYIKIYSSSC